MKSEFSEDYEVIDALVADLVRFKNSIPLEGLDGALRRLTVPEPFIEKEATFGAHGYCRTSLYRSEKIEVLLLCWESGQCSPIHDHVGSNCAFKVLRGTATETRFETVSEERVVSRGLSELPQGTVCASKDEDIHQMSNDQEDGSRLVTLHIYSPPLGEMNTFSQVEPRGETRDRRHGELLASAAE